MTAQRLKDTALFQFIQTGLKRTDGMALRPPHSGSGNRAALAVQFRGQMLGQNDAFLSGQQHGPLISVRPPAAANFFMK